MNKYIHSDEPYCSKCKTFEGPFTKYASNKLKDGTLKKYYNCLPCNTKRAYIYRHDRGGMKSVYKSTQKFVKKNPEKLRAWQLAKNIPIQPCERCGSEERIHRHHEDYSKPLEVRFLCPVHHSERHRELKGLQKL